MGIVSECDHFTKKLEKAWIKAVDDIQNEDEYNQSTAIQFTEIKMKRLIKRTFDISLNDLEKAFTENSPERAFELGATYFKTKISKALMNEGRYIEVEQLWDIFQEVKQKDMTSALEFLEGTRNIKADSLNKYLYFALGVKSISHLYRNRFQEIPTIDLEEEGEKAKYRLKKINRDLNEMDENLNKDQGVIETCNSKIEDIQKRISKTEKEVTQMALEIKGEISKSMLPHLGNMEESLQDITTRIQKTEISIEKTKKQLEYLGKYSNTSTMLVKRLEEKYKKDMETVYNLAQRFLAGDSQFMVIQKEIFQSLGGTQQALLDSLEYSLHIYTLENAAISERISLKITELERKIASAPQYNFTILHFWIRALKHIHTLSYKTIKVGSQFKTQVTIEWQKGIEEMLQGLDDIFNDKDALKAMRATVNYQVPTVSGQDVWNRYRRTDEETRKRLYEKMKGFKNDATFLRIAIPSILSTAILNTAVRHRDIPGFIWFCSVAYDEMLTHYHDLLNEMVKKRIEKG
jgi:archaellum component FlaC